MNIALLGCGVVGGGVLEIAEKRADMSVRYVLVRRDKPELGEKAVKDINVILNDDEVDRLEQKQRAQIFHQLCQHLACILALLQKLALQFQN